MRKNLYDNLGRIIGYIEKIGQETHIFDNKGRFLGKYLPMTEQVFDVSGRLVGKGIEILGTLIKK